MIYYNDIDIVKARFIKRPNRFIAHVELNGEESIVHVPNTGRCKEILIPGSIVILRRGKNPLRKTKFDLIAGYKGKKLINIDSQVPNHVVYEALIESKVSKLKEYTKVEREKTFGNSRFDFKLSNDNNDIYYLEVKGVTFEQNGKCMFPDAPTDRGTRHLLELIDAKSQGYGAGVLFLIQMNEADSFTPYKDMDKKFAEALRLAYNNDVDVFAYSCNVGENFIEINKEIKVII